MFHIGMTQWIVGDEPLEVSCARLKNCGYDGIELAAQPYHLDAGQVWTGLPFSVRDFR